MDVEIDQELNGKLDDFWNGFWKGLRTQTAFILEAYGLHFG